MTFRLWVKVPVVVWVMVGVLSTSTCAHNTHRNPYLDPDLYDDPRINLRHHIPLNQMKEEDCELRDDLAIQVRGDKQKVIDLALRYGLEYLDQVFETPAIFHLRRPLPTSNRENRSKRHIISEKELVEAIAREPGVDWVDQQVAFTRQKRRTPGNIQIEKTTSQEVKRKNVNHEIPADVYKSRRVIRRMLQNPKKAAHFEASKDRSMIESRIIHDYWREDLDIEGISYSENETGSIKQVAHRPENPQYRHGNGFENQHESMSSGNKLVRIPLSKNVGSGFKFTQTDSQNPEQRNSYYDTYVGLSLPNGHEEGRVYDHRDFQLNNEIQLPSEGERNERGDGEFVTVMPPNSEENGRDFGQWIDQLVKSSMAFNDPFYNDQWYLRNTGQLGRQGHDLNVTWAWLQGYTGRGVILSVLDDGLQTTNADISANYAPSISYSLIRDGGPEDDPSPRIDSSFSNSHGTYCAGIMAAVPNNSVCGVGVAYESKVGAVRLVDGKVTDVQEATALSRHIDKVDIFSASWGPTDDGTKVEGPGRLTKHAFVEGVTKGRGGKGAIYVWASGNGGMVGDNCNLDGYTSSIYTLSVSALTDVGASTFYEEPCASTLAAVYVGGEHTLKEAKERDKRHSKTLKVVVPELDGHCSEDFQGTSAAAPLMAGILALVIQANGNLTWRDVQHLVVDTSSPTPSALQEPGWQTNGNGKQFHPMQGFGAVNAGRMVEAALHWQNVKPQKIIIAPMFNGYREFEPYTWMNVTKVVDSSKVPSSDVTMVIEHVVANITLSHPLRRLLTIYIVSPSGTMSQVLTHRAPDTSQSGFKLWEFMSVHFWGENPQGIWKVAIKDDSGKKGFLKKVELVIYGS